jgi:hypothetical protein
MTPEATEAALYDIATRAHAWYVVGPDGQPSDAFDAQVAHLLSLSDGSVPQRPHSQSETALASFWRLIALIESPHHHHHHHYVDDDDDELLLLAGPERDAEDADALRTQLLRIVLMLSS